MDQHRDEIHRADWLIGRDLELSRIDTVLRNAAGESAGGALILSGDPGVGKTALLDAGVALAEERGMATLRMCGVSAEAQLAFGGLHQLLRPLLSELDAISLHQADALRAAFAFDAGRLPETYLVALASLELLAAHAAHGPMLIVADDLHWLDGASSSVLSFIGRRIGHEPIALVGAGRVDEAHIATFADLPELRVEALNSSDARTLVERHGPDLGADERRRVLREARGNALALVELPRALQAGQSRATDLEPLPVTTRIARSFGARVARLPAVTQQLLVVAAANAGVDDLGSLIRAAEILLHRPVSADELAPALDSRLVHLDGETLRFDHPIVRSAVYESAPLAERRAAHAALAVAHELSAERRIWHLAASRVGPDEAIATGLEAAALAARRRGDAHLALALLDRSISLGIDPAARCGRVLRAGELVFQLDGPRASAHYAREAAQLIRSASDRARLMLLRESMEDDPGDTDEGRVLELVNIAAPIADEGSTDLAMNLLLAAAMRCWRGDVSAATRQRTADAIRSLDTVEMDPRPVCAVAFADPDRFGGAVGDTLATIVAPEGIPTVSALLAAAATAIGSHDLVLPLSRSAVAGFRSTGSLAPLVQALVTQAWAEYYCGHWETASMVADEAARLARETAQQRWSIAADLVRAVVAAARGDAELGERLAGAAERDMATAADTSSLSGAAAAKGLAAMARGSYADAFRQFSRIGESADPAFHPFVCDWYIGELTDAALRIGATDRIAPILDRVAGRADRARLDLAQIGAMYARAVLSTDHAEARFEEALAADLTLWPVHRARLLAAYGAWLRRARQIGRSREALKEAIDIFDRLGALPLGDRARTELRATGERARRRVPDAITELSPQELQIAHLAAEGLSNREIGQRLYLSHRTVSSHLYRIFPKLGITTRAQLGGRLGPP